jgi:hypothetical protein
MESDEQSRLAKPRPGQKTDPLSGHLVNPFFIDTPNYCVHTQLYPQQMTFCTTRPGPQLTATPPAPSAPLACPALFPQTRETPLANVSYLYASPHDWK